MISKVLQCSRLIYDMHVFMMILLQLHKQMIIESLTHCKFYWRTYKTSRLLGIFFCLKRMPIFWHLRTDAQKSHNKILFLGGRTDNLHKTVTNLNNSVVVSQLQEMKVTDSIPCHILSMMYKNVLVNSIALYPVFDGQYWILLSYCTSDGYDQQHGVKSNNNQVSIV